MPADIIAFPAAAIPTESVLECQFCEGFVYALVEDGASCLMCGGFNSWDDINETLAELDS